MDLSVVSGDDLLDMAGAGYLDIVGSDALQQSPDVKEALLARGSVLVNKDAAYKAREYPLGFDSVANVAAGATVNINSQPQIYYRLERLVIPSDIAGAFVVNDIQVGKNSQFANDQPVPARVFDERAVGVRLRGNTAQTSQNIVLSVTNISGAPVRFRAAVVGTALDQ